MDNRNTPPGKVSPLIKGARWTFLLTGIVYGATRLKVLTKKEKVRKEIWLKAKAEKDQIKAAEKLRRAKEEEKELSQIVGLPVPNV